MTTAATQDTPDVATVLGEIKKECGTLRDGLEQLKSRPSLNRAHVGADGMAVGYWDGEGETCVVKVHRDGPQEMSKKMRTSLAKGYRNKEFKSFGQFLQEGYNSHKEQRAGEFKSRHDGIFKAVQGMSAQEGAAAGYFILPEFNEQILERVYANDIWGQTDQYTVNNNMVFIANAETSRANGSRHGGMRGYWTDEGAAGTKSKPTFRRIELNLKKLMIIVYLTDELIADGGAALERYVAKAAAEEFNFMLGDSVFNGLGNGMPLGVLNAPATLSITKENLQPATTIVTENIDKMWARRFASGKYNWYHNQDCGPQLDRLTQDVGSGGVVLYRDSEGLAKPMPQVLKGVARREIEFAKTLGTVGDITLADLSQYLTISKGGINQAYSTHVEFLTDQTAIRLTMRVNGRPWEASPVTPFQGTNTQASFLNLATRS